MHCNIIIATLIALVAIHVYVPMNYKVGNIYDQNEVSFEDPNGNGFCPLFQDPDKTKAKKVPNNFRLENMKGVGDVVYGAAVTVAVVSDPQAFITYKQMSCFFSGSCDFFDFALLESSRSFFPERSSSSDSDADGILAFILAVIAIICCIMIISAVSYSAYTPLFSMLSVEGQRLIFGSVVIAFLIIAAVAASANEESERDYYGNRRRKMSNEDIAFFSSALAFVMFCVTLGAMFALS